MHPKLNWQAYTNRNRTEVLEAVKEAVNRHNGYIIAFNRFSDLALSLSMEVEAQNIPGLFKAIQQLVRLSGPLPDDGASFAHQEWLVLLHISFAKGKGDLEIEVPAVPG